MKSLGRSDPQGSRVEQNENNDILRQITCLSSTVQNLGRQMQEGFAVEKLKRQEEHVSMEKDSRLSVWRESRLQMRQGKTWICWKQK